MIIAGGSLLTELQNRSDDPRPPGQGIRSFSSCYLDTELCSSIHALQRLSACSSAAFLVVKVESVDSKRLISIVEFSSGPNTIPLECHSFPDFGIAIP
jgi:hypothetical protein